VELVVIVVLAMLSGALLTALGVSWRGRRRLEQRLAARELARNPAEYQEVVRTVVWPGYAENRYPGYLAWPGFPAAEPDRRPIVVPPAGGTGPPWAMVRPAPMPQVHGRGPLPGRPTARS
jgi:type II secretory pathway pseudopilin PulG